MRSISLTNFVLYAVYVNLKRKLFTKDVLNVNLYQWQCSNMAYSN